jgi:Tfp pilus assembly protein PilF
MAKKAPDKSDDSSPSFERFVIPSVLLMLLLIVIYGNSFHGPFLFDDLFNIVENPNIHSRNLSFEEISPAVYGADLRKASGRRRPVSYLTLAVNHSLGGLDPFGYHVVNFSVHALSALLLFFFTYRVLLLSAFRKTRSRESLLSIALLSAALWASHPIQVTAVTYIVQRMAALAGLFTLLAMFSYIEARTAKTRLSVGIYISTCLIFGALAVGSKENAAMLPVNLLLLEIFVVGGQVRKSRKRNRYLFGISVFLVLFAGLWFTDIGKILAGYENRPFTLGQRLLTEPRVFLFYLSQLIYPVSQRFTMLHDVEVSTGLLTPWATLPAILLVAALPVGAWLLRKRWPLICFSLLFFWVNHLIEGTVVPLEIVFEHRNYLPSMFVFLPPAMGLFWLVEKYSLRYFPALLSVFLAVVFLFVQGHTTFMRNETFSNPVLLWLDNVRKSPALHRPHHNLGEAYLTYGFEEEGVHEFEIALKSRAAARRNQKFYTHHSLGAYYLSKNKPAAAARHLQAALAHMPKSGGKALLDMSRAMRSMGRLMLAERYATAALGTGSQRADALTILGWIRLQQNKPREARRLAIAAWASSPGNRRPSFLAGEAFRMENDLARSLHFYKVYNQAYPEDRFALAALAEVQALLGHRTDLEITVWKLLENAGGQLADVLAQYDRNCNFMGASRMARIERAIDQTVRQTLQNELRSPVRREQKKAPPLPR